MNNQPEPKEKIFDKAFYLRIIIDVVILGLFGVLYQKYLDNRFAPQTALDVLTVQTRLTTKKEVYIEAIHLMNKEISDINLYDPKVKNDTLRKRDKGGTYPTEIEVNDCFAKLCIYAGNKEIPLTFRDLFNKHKNPILLISNFNKLIRNDLGNGEAIVDTVGDNYKYIQVYSH